MAGQQNPVLLPVLAVNDPLVSALVAALEEVLGRGVAVTPMFPNGWRVGLAPAPSAEKPAYLRHAEAAEAAEASGAYLEPTRRSW